MPLPTFLFNTSLFLDECFDNCHITHTTSNHKRSHFVLSCTQLFVDVHSILDQTLDHFLYGASNLVNGMTEKDILQSGISQLTLFLASPGFHFKSHIFKQHRLYKDKEIHYSRNALKKNTNQLIFGDSKMNGAVGLELVWTLNRTIDPADAIAVNHW